MTDVLVFGESLIDLIEDTHTPTRFCTLYRAHPGGSPFNAALALARQGLKTGFATPISTDAYGQILMDRLGKWGGAYAYPGRVDLATS